MDEQKNIEQQSTKSESKENWFWKITTYPGFFIGFMLVLSIILRIIQYYNNFEKGNSGLSNMFMFFILMPMGIAFFLGSILDPIYLSPANYIFIAIWLEIIIASILIPIYKRKKGIILKTLIIITIILILLSFTGCALMTNIIDYKSNFGE